MAGLRTIALLALPIAASACRPAGEDAGCVPTLCYAAEEGSAPLLDGTPVWTLSWEQFKSGDVDFVPLPGQSGSEREAPIAFVRSASGSACVRYFHNFTDPSSFRLSAWAKVKGYAPITSFPLSCTGVSKLAVSPVSDADEVLTSCATPDGGAGCSATAALVEEDGTPLVDLAHVWLVEAPDGGSDGTVAMPCRDWSTDGVLTTPAGPSLIFAHGHMPVLKCLSCGNQRVTLQRWP